MTEAIQRVGDRIVEAAGLRHADRWEAVVVKDSGDNASVLPNGEIVVHYGPLQGEEAIRSHRTQGWLMLESSSVSFGKATAYLPLIDLLKAYLQLEDRDTTQRVREKVTGKVLTLDDRLQDAIPPLPWLLEPVMLVFEDLHWIDSETQSLLDSPIEGLPTARMLLLVNDRPEYQHGWGGQDVLHAAPDRSLAARMSSRRSRRSPFPGGAPGLACERWSAHPSLRSPWSQVRQLQGPQVRTWAWCSRRSRNAATVAVSPRSLRSRDEERRGPFIAPHDHLQEIIGYGLRQLRHSQIVNDEQGDGCDMGEVRLAGAVEHGRRSLGGDCSSYERACRRQRARAAWRAARRTTSARGAVQKSAGS